MMSAAYFYNGVPLPDIYSVYTPEMQKTHPYAYMVIQRSFEGYAHRAALFLTTVPLYPHEIASAGLSHVTGYAKADGECVVYICGSSDSSVNAVNSEFVLDPDDDYAGAFVAGEGATWNCSMGSSLHNGVLWANYDLYDYDDGTLYLAASDPVPVYNATEFWNGVALGLSGTGVPAFEESSCIGKGYLAGAELRRNRPKIVAYSYNGVELPALPDWDKETYPYAVISLFENDYHKGYLMDISATPYVAYAVASGNAGNSLTITVPAMIYSLVDSDGEETTSSDGEWVLSRDLSGETENYFRHGKYYSLFWANYDVSGSDGTVYLAASDPVPVYG